MSWIIGVMLIDEGGMIQWMEGGMWWDFILGNFRGPGATVDAYETRSNLLSPHLAPQIRVQVILWNFERAEKRGLGCGSRD